ncbi:MAG: restriction endonuclease subunit S [Ardenticatenia bacterium]|nr:restriction endonuclease subunit S [Ardenticatenia bacterium]
MSWSHGPLGKFLKLRYGKSLPDRERQDGDIRVYGSGGVIGTHVEALVAGPGVIVGRKGSVGSVFFEPSDYFPIDTVFYVEPRGDAVVLRYAYYLLTNLPLASLNTDAAVPGLKREWALSIEVSLPPRHVQEVIVGVLSAYDDLIANNRRRMALLEEAARQLYREWFVRLRFAGHEHTRINNGVPDLWERFPLGDRVTLNYGKALKAEDRVEGPCPVYGSSGIVGAHDQSLTTAPGIVVGRKGNVGSVYWCPKDYWPIDTVYFIDAETSNLWLYYSLRHMHFISTDVAVPGLNRDFAYSRPLLVPEPGIVRDFLETAVPLQEQIRKLDEMNDKLRAARDLLLPRLMSGDIAV